MGSCLSIILADRLGLKYSTAAGIITLLTIQDTKKETIIISLKRLIAFIVATFLAFIIFPLVGFNAIAFGFILLIYVWFCYHYQMHDAISLNSVLVTHYLLEGNMKPELLNNELLLFLIGAGIGTLLNLYIPSNVKHIRSIQKTIETDLKKVLNRISEYLVNEIKDNDGSNCFDTLEEHIQSGIKQAYANMNNTFLQETQYFITYMEMRKQQCIVLKSIYEKIKTLEFIPNQALEISEFINHISNTFAESNNAKNLLLEGDALLTRFRESPLPITREEFEARAILYMIMKDFEYFLKIKESFADSLTGEQISRYWGM